VINILIFLLIFNWSYIQKKRLDPSYPNKPITSSLLFPAALAVAYTLLVDAYKGVIYYQLILFLVVAAVLYWKLVYGARDQGR